MTEQNYTIVYRGVSEGTDPIKGPEWTPNLKAAERIAKRGNSTPGFVLVGKAVSVSRSPRAGRGEGA